MSLYPPSLFKDALMRKPDKPTLRKVLLKDEDKVNVDTAVPSSYVLYGAALLHQVKWLKSSTYKDLAQGYVSHVRRHSLQPLCLTVKTTLYQRRQMHITEDPLLGVRTL